MLAANQESTPARRASRLAREALESVLLAVKSLPGRVDRSSATRPIHDALSALDALEASAASADDLRLLDRVRDAVRASRENLAGRELNLTELGRRAARIAERLAGIERALHRVREATIDAVVAHPHAAPIPADARQAAPARGVPAPEPFAASVGVPRLFAFEREPIAIDGSFTPAAMAFEEDLAGEARQEDFADAAGSLERELSAGGGAEEEHASRDALLRLPLLGVAAALDGDEEPALGAGPSGEQAQLERLAQDCLDEIGAMSVLCFSSLGRPREDEPFVWSAVARFEQRMLSALDALIALGQPFFTAGGRGARSPGLDLFALLERYGSEAIATDSGRAFARALSLGSIAGEDTARGAALALCESHPYTLAAQAQALSLGSNPAIAPAMLRLSQQGDARLIAVALDVLFARGHGEIATALPLLSHASPSVRARAARALCLAPERDVAERHLCELARDEEDDQVLVAAAESLALLGAGQAVAIARERLAQDAEDPGSLPQPLRARLLQLIGIAGSWDDGELLARCFTAGAGEALALGFHGHAGHVETLLDVLRPGSSRTSGGSVRGSVRAEAAAALRRLTGAQVGAVPVGARDGGDFDPYRPSAEHAPWQAWWSEHGARFDNRVRHRFGEPFSALHSATELCADTAPLAVRRLCALELGVLLGRPAIDVGALTAQQARAIAEQRAAIDQAIAGGQERFAAGRWPSFASASRRVSPSLRAGR